jgi:hypothetical protein
MCLYCFNCLPRSIAFLVSIALLVSVAFLVSTAFLVSIDFLVSIVFLFLIATPSCKIVCVVKVLILNLVPSFVCSCKGTAAQDALVWPSYST